MRGGLYYSDNVFPIIVNLVQPFEHTMFTVEPGAGSADSRQEIDGWNPFPYAFLTHTKLGMPTR